MNQHYLATLIKSPVYSEKSTAATDQSNQYVFKVQKCATKPEIRKAVEKMFKVEVEAVQVMNVKGKNKRFQRILGKRSDWKKAYVKLKPDFKIDLFGQ
ncbi:MAG: 50S ribosomal protein L23 [Methylococcales bacterium]